MGLPPLKIAVLGGGISGLTSAYVLSKRLALASSRSFELVVFEKQENVGGCLKTVALTHPCASLGSHHSDRTPHYLDCGCHSFRTNSAAVWTLDLVRRVGLQDALVAANPVARNRFVMVQGKLWCLGIVSILRLTNWVRLLCEMWIPRYRGKPVGRDESISSFFGRRFGTSCVDIFVRALVNGIFAGNPDSLSMRAAFPDPVRWEEECGSILWYAATCTLQFCWACIRNKLHIMSGRRWFSIPAAPVSEKLILGEKEGDDSEGTTVDGGTSFPASSYTFREGMQQFAFAVEKALEDSGILVVKSTTILQVRRKRKTGGVEIIYRNTDDVCEELVEVYDLVISAVPSPSLCDLISIDSGESEDEESTASPTLRDVLSKMRAMPFAPVDVIHAVHQEPKEGADAGRSLRLPTYIHNPEYNGYGYLSSSSGGPETCSSTTTSKRTVAFRGVLGVLFNSVAFPERYNRAFPAHWIQSYTIMMRPDNFSPENASHSEANSRLECHIPEPCQNALRGILITSGASSQSRKKQPSWMMPSNLLWHRYRWDAAIPQYPVGHLENVSQLRSQIDAFFHSRLVLCGFSYDGISLNHAIASGKRAADRAFDTLMNL